MSFHPSLSFSLVTAHIGLVYMYTLFIGNTIENFFFINSLCLVALYSNMLSRTSFSTEQLPRRTGGFRGHASVLTGDTSERPHILQRCRRLVSSSASCMKKRRWRTASAIRTELPKHRTGIKCHGVFVEEGVQ